MFTQNEEITKTIVISTLIILGFAVAIVIAILKYRNKQRELLEREIQIKNELVKVMLEAKEQTLKELSVRIHGDIQQSLSLVKLNLNKVLLNKDNIDPNKVLEIKGLIVDTITEVKDLSRELDPKYIVGHTMEENIVELLDHVARNTDLETEFNTSEDELNPDSETQIFVYRIVQEAINNVLAHAKATSIKIDLTSSARNFIIEIEDDGLGFNVASVMNEKSGLGLISMKSRTELLNGDFSINSKPHNGTKISITIPYND